MKWPEWVLLLVAGVAGAQLKRAEDRADYWRPISERWASRFIGCTVAELRQLRKERAISPLPDDEGIAKENEDGWDILICQSCGQDVGRGRPGAGVTILKCVPCSQLSTEVLRESPFAKEKTKDEDLTRVDTPGSPVDSRTAAKHEVE